MELRQLEYAVAVAEELSFTRAATRLRVAQPAVSQQVRRLERELGQQLFDRSDRQVRVTPAGDVFVAHAAAALAAARAGMDALRSRDGTLTGVLRLGTISHPPAWLYESLAQFRQAHPAVRVVLTDGDPAGLTEAVATGAVDVALIGTVGERRPAGRSGAAVGRGLAVQAVAEEPLVALVPATHPLAGRKEVTLRALAAAGLVTLRPGRGLRAVLEDAFAALDVRPDIGVEVDELGSVPRLVAALSLIHI